MTIKEIAQDLKMSVTTINTRLLNGELKGKKIVIDKDFGGTMLKWEIDPEDYAVYKAKILSTYRHGKCLWCNEPFYTRVKTKQFCCTEHRLLYKQKHRIKDKYDEEPALCKVKPSASTQSLTIKQHLIIASDLGIPMEEYLTDENKYVAMWVQKQN